MEAATAEGEPIFVPRECVGAAKLDHRASTNGLRCSNYWS